MKNRFLQSSLAIIGLVLIAFGLFIFWAVGKSLPKRSQLELENSQAEIFIQPKDQFTILTYNIAHGQGIKIEPTDWRDEIFTRKKISELTHVIQKVNPDILNLQEVDLDSNRTHHINQSQWIADLANYPYRACALVWDENYVPYPYWPIEHQLGQTKSANCILSRYPLSNHRRFLFDKPKKNAFWYNWAYLDRGAQIVEIQVGNKKFNLVNVHLEAFDPSSRQEQVTELLNILKTLRGPIVLAGDFNSIPPEAVQKKGFLDDQNTDFSDDHSIQTVRSGIPKFTEAPSSGFTFPADSPTQRLDALFAYGGIEILHGHVVNEAGQASDHLPVLGLMVFQK